MTKAEATSALTLACEEIARLEEEDGGEEPSSFINIFSVHSNLSA
jgi:hypothetical protein